MSRTDKDAPYWVGGWWEPWHTLSCRYRHRVCTLPDAPPKRPPTAKWDTGPLCRWDPKGGPHRPAPPRWFVNEIWTAPTRQTARVDCARAVAEYRATGEVDTIPPTWQHRNGAKWDWW